MEYKIPQIKMIYISDSACPLHKIECVKDVVEKLRQTYEPGEIEMQEYFKVVYLNHGNKIIGIHTISMGGTAICSVDAKIIFGGALTAKASALILCHNHPSGNTSPSYQDDNLTKKLKQAAEIFDMRILDHIILTTDGYYSYMDNSRL